MNDGPVGGRLRPVLLVDASLQGVQAALVDLRPDVKERVLWSGAHHENKGAVQAISTLIGSGFTALGLSPDLLSGLAVGVGPGSFTGIKVGLAFAYGLKSARSTELPMLGVSTLEAAAVALARSSGTPVAVLLPATKTHGFAVLAQPAATVPARLIDTETSAEPFLAQLAPGTQLFFAAPWPLLAALVAARVPHLLSATLTLPGVTVAALPVLVEQMLQAWPEHFSSKLPEPRYLRLSTAEERLQTDLKQAPSRGLLEGIL